MTDWETGIVQRWFPQRGYGWVIPDREEDEHPIFTHARSLPQIFYLGVMGIPYLRAAPLAACQRVRFLIESGPRGPRAKKCEVYDG